MLEVCPKHGTEQHDTSVVHEHINRPKLRPSALNQRASRSLISNISRHSKSTPTISDDPPSEPLDPIRAPSRKSNGITLTGQGNGSRRANSRRGTGDDSDTISHAPSLGSS
jgi:hypothetical protein